jgi:hypothetical protein
VRRAASLILIATALTAAAQQPKPNTRPAKPAPAAEDAAPATQLPVTRVSLYKNGVGFFEHDGRVTGSQSVTIDFTTDQLNDVLQSLTAIDLNGGRITGAGYNSTTPLDQQLKALALALPDKTTFSILFNALRGTRVEVTGSASPFTGRLVDEEMHKTGAGKDEAGMTEGRFLTVAADSGEVRIFAITPSLSVRLLDTAAHTNLTQYLQLLDSNRNTALRHLTLDDVGTGARQLRVSYISEVPIWKSTYRILFTESKPSGAQPPSTTQTATLQGWSVVDNTTGADWINVQLSLIAGAPQSFIQPLSVPYYSRRPEIPLPQEAQLTPQTHESGQQGASNPVSGAVSVDAADQFKVSNQVAARPIAGAAMGALGGVMGGSGSGIGAGSGGNFGGGLARPIDTLGTLENETYQNLAVRSTAPNATTTAFDDYFAYNLADPITIRKNESALVPILQTKVDAERVTLWSQQQPTPLRALWITNTSNLTLDRGSFTIVEDGNFGGEGLLDPIHPAEKRLLSYAVDQAVRVTTESRLNSSRVTSITASKGVLVLHSKQVSEITYVVHNAAADPRMVIVEHPVRNGYTVDSAAADGTPAPKPIETTPAVYRFRVATQPGETVRLHVGETHPGAATYRLTNSDDNQLTFILTQANHDPALEAALQPILAARRHQSDMQEAVDKINAHLNDLHSDEDRQRANVTALANADKSARERFVHDLNATEDQIAAAAKDLATAQANLQSAKDDLATKITNLQIDETVPPPAT